MGRGNNSGRHGGRTMLVAALMAAASPGILATLVPSPALAQGTQQSFAIGAGSLSDALTVFGQQSGLQISFPAALAAGRSSPGVNGTLSAEQALGQLLTGSGLSYSFTNSSTVSIFAAADYAALGADGSILLEEVNVTAWVDGMGVPMTADAPYSAPASVSYVSGESISRFRGSSVGDFLRGTPGVLTGASTEKGALDLNVRGIQGMDRVPVILDGTRQAQTVYEGYAGVSTRTYIDPDLIGGVTIEKGPSAAADAVGAVGGLARMRTIDASDILDDGESIGLRVQGGVASNAVEPPAIGTKGGIDLTLLNKNYAPGALPTSWGDGNYDRPEPFDFGSYNGNLVLATRNETIELLAAYAKRKQGNYFSGTNGDGGGYVKFEEQTNGQIRPTLGGLGSYRPGEEVLNSGFDNSTLLLKGKVNLGENHTFDLSYMNFNGTLAEMPWPGLTGVVGGAFENIPSESTSGTWKAGYHWDVEGDAVDLKINWWSTDTFLKQNFLFDPYGEIAYEFDSKRRGIDIENTSFLTGDFGDLTLNYGASFTQEDLFQLGISRLAGFEDSQPDRSGNRDEASAFIASEWNPTEWLQVDAALRYTNTVTVDDCISVNATTCYGEQRNDAWSPIIAATIEPWEGVQLYARYSEATRSPSLFEATAGASFQATSFGIKPEHAQNREIGINLLRDDLFTAGDKAGVKLAYFDNNMTDYITRRRGGAGEPLFVLTNLDFARFKGIEISADYESDTFFGSLGYTRYLETEFCGDIALNTYSCALPGGNDSFVLLHVPPRDTLSLTGGVKLFDALTVGARATYTGERVVEEPTKRWEPYTLVDVFASYEFSDDMKLDLGIDNVGDVFYVNPGSIQAKPGAGRTVRATLTAKF